MNTVLTPNVLKNNHLTMEDIHSFVLRVYLNPAPDGRGTARPHFNLEYVNQNINKRMQNLDEVLEELTARIELILHSPDGGLN
jgi:hypothetical protein